MDYKDYKNMDYHDKEHYDNMKSEVMEDSEIQFSNRLLDYYNSSYRDKEERGLFDKWEEIESYWEGNVNLPEKDSDPASNVNIIHPNIEGQVALLVEQNIAVEVQPQGVSDIAFAETTEIILNWILRKNRMKRKLDVHERRREKFGTGIFRVLFDPDKYEGMGLPIIEPCNPAYVFPDPNVTDMYKVDEGRFMIETVNKSIEWAKNNTRFDEDRVRAIMPNYMPNESEYLFGEDDGQTDDISRDNYLHMFVWIKDKTKLRLIEMSACGIILWDSKEEGIEYPKDKFPYFFTPLYYREGTVWAKGDAENLIPLQDMINDIDDQIRINARLTGNPQKLISNSSAIDLEMWTNEPGLNIPCNDPNQAYRPVIPPSMPQYPIDRRKYALEYEASKITRFSDQATGIRQQGVDTATEALALQQAGTAGISYKKILLQETLSDMCLYILDLVKEYYTEENAFAITEKPTEFIWFRGSKLKKIPKLIPASMEFNKKFRERNPEVPTPDYMPATDSSGRMITKEACFDINVTVGAGMPSNKAFVYQVINESFAKGIITPQEARKLLRDYVSLPVPEKPEQPEQPPVQEMPQQQPMQGQQAEQTQTTQNPNVQGMTRGGNPMMGGSQ